MALKALGGLVVAQCRQNCPRGPAAGVTRLGRSGFRRAAVVPRPVQLSHRRMLFGRASAVVQAALKQGDSLADYSDYFRKLKNTKGEMVSLSQFKNEAPVVLFFYPKAGTPGCTKQAQTFRDAYDEFQKLGAVVFGISGDQMDAQEGFVKDNSLPYPLLVDDGNKLRQAFGIKADLFGALPGRQTFVIDKNGKCVLSYNNQLQAETHAAEALKAVKKL